MSFTFTTTEPPCRPFLTIVTVYFFPSVAELGFLIWCNYTQPYKNSMNPWLCPLGAPYLLKMSLCMHLCVNRRVKTERAEAGNTGAKWQNTVACEWLWSDVLRAESLFFFPFLFTSSLSSDAEGTRWHWVSACVLHFSCFDSHTVYHKHCEHASLYIFNRCLGLTGRHIIPIPTVILTDKQKHQDEKNWK